MGQQQKWHECVGERVKDVQFENEVDQIIDDHVVYESFEERVLGLQFEEH